MREGGYLIGIVSSLKPVTLENGQTGAQLTLKLNKAYGEVPIDSTVSIQPRSVLGLKYLDLHKGTSTHMFADGATLPVDADERAGPVRRRVQDVRRQHPSLGPGRISTGSGTRSPRAGRR